MNDFELSFSDNNITPWGGMSLMKRMLDRMGFVSALENCGLPVSASNRGYSPTQLIQQFMISIWCGANRYEHTEITRMDDVLRSIFGFTRMAGHRAVSRFFGKFNHNLCGKVFDNLFSWFFKSININYVTLDLDSIVITRYGNNQEGATKGYNPNKIGRPSISPANGLRC
ncbi:MAG: transposase [Pseudomonadota bacterium]